jgi:hypothetical protein
MLSGEVRSGTDDASIKDAQARGKPDHATAA